MYVVATRPTGEMLLIGRLLVGEVTDLGGARRHFGSQAVWDAPDHLLGVPPFVTLRHDRVIPEDVARAIQRATGRLLKIDPDRYFIRGIALAAVSEITAKSAALLDGVIDDDEHSSRSATDGSAPLTGPERQAIDLCGMDRAREALEQAGYDVSREPVYLTEPYDFAARLRGTDVRVEVKATTKPAFSTIELTAGEVESASAHRPTVLVLVTGGPHLRIAAGGRWRRGRAHR